MTAQRMNTTSMRPAATSSLAPRGKLQRKCACGQHTPGGGACGACATKDKSLRRHAAVTHEQAAVAVPAVVHEVLRTPGQPLDAATRDFFEPRFGYDFSGIQTTTPHVAPSALTVGPAGDSFEQEAEQLSRRLMHAPAAPTNGDRAPTGRYSLDHVRVHMDTRAAESARAVSAAAYTVGRDVVFGAGQYAPGTEAGRSLLAHELAHVIQQTSGVAGPNLVQCRNLTSPRLRGNQRFENVLDNRNVIEVGDRGPEVRRIQQLLMDLGFDLSVDGTDGRFGSETEAAVKEFQRRHGLTDDGRVGFATMNALDREFPAFALPANRANPWSMACVLGILCPWNRHLVEDVLPGFNIITFNSRTFPTETWDGAAWRPGTFVSGGFTSGTNMGFLNSTTCEEMALTIYHEGWHAQQASSLTGVVDTERDAYINTEQWSISMGVPGQTFRDRTTGTVRGLRTTRLGETVVDEPAAETLVRQSYGGVSATPGERVLRRVGATDVHVRRPDGTEYDRPANVGESVRGAVSMPGQHPINPADWNCP
ncbi:MAG: DUF4157 domain-containing protein [Pyrinomonadaceae bacterium]